MEAGGQRREWEYWWISLCFSLLVSLGHQGSAQIRYSVPEEVKEGSVVGNCAKDLGLDVSTLVERRFRIVSGSNDALFQVNQNNGILYVGKHTDREEVCDGNSACLINLKIVVEKPLEVHYVEVEITDVNDHSPSFHDKDLFLEVAENTVTGTRFELQTARDLDVGVNSVRFYQLKTDEAQHKLLILVKDNGNVSLSATATVIVKVVEPKEAFAASDVKHAVKDEEENDVTFYLIITLGSVSVLFVISIIVLIDTFFQVNQNNGILYVHKKIDREEICDGNGACLLSLKIAVENPLEVHYVEVEITDVNDHFPSFPEKDVHVEIAENTVKGTRFDLPTARDLDVGVNSIRSYRLGQNDHFDIEIRDKTDEAQHKLLILVKDNGNVSLSATATVIVKVVEPKEAFAASDVKHAVKDEEENDVTFYLIITLGSVSVLFVISIIVLIIHYVEVEISDINDHSPRFPDKEQRLRISENTLPGADNQLQAARDPDSGTNSVRSYKLSPNDHFEIRVREKTDEAQHKLLILVKDNGNVSLSATATVIVKVVEPKEAFAASDVKHTVKDEEENDVTFYLIITLGSVSVLFVISIIVLILQAARDPDYGTNSVRSYKISTNDHFEIRVRENDEDKMPFLVLKKAVDREITTTYKLLLTAVDGGNPPKSGTLTINITVLDINDNRPVFSRETYSVILEENSAIGTVVLQVNATDMDEGPNSNIEYSFATLNSKVHEVFELDQVTGEIRVKGKVDFEDTEVYKLDIQASDKGHPPMSAKSRIVIKIIDVNDNQPEIEITSHSKNIPEDSKPGTVISLISVTDKDAGINDSGSPSLSSNVTVNVFILDQNDNVPVILYPVSANGSAEGVEEIPRNVNAGHLVTKVRAYDADIGYNGWLLFSLQEVSDHSPFSLDRYTGQIRTLRSFTETDEAQHKLLILVKDNGNVSLSATATVIVKVVEPKEAFAASDVKHTVKDEEENDVTFYLIITLGSVSVLFVISIIVLIVMQCSKSTDYSSKYLQDTNYDGTLCHSIQYRSGDKRYMLVGPRMSIGSTIAPGSNRNTLVIPDRRRRDSGEQISAQVRYSISEEVKVGSIVGNIAKDLGLEINALEDRRFRIVSGSEETLFQFQVAATDSGSPSLSSNVTVNVFILDQNDNVPVILYPVSANGSAEGVEEIPRNVNAGHLVTKVRAYDADIGYNGWLLFSLQEVSDHSPFSLDRYTGQIRTLRSFTETDEAQHKLLILVKDNGNVSLSATATVIVKVVEPKEAFAASDVKHTVKDEEENDVTFYLIITLGSVSVLFVISIIVLIVMQCSKSTDYSSKYLQDTNYDGTLCHSIQYRSGDKRYMLVGPRMSIGSTIAPGSNRNTLVIPDRRRRDSGEQVSAQIKYSVPEEVKEGSVVGNVAKDLGIDVSALVDRRFRIVSGSKDAPFQVNLNNGMLYVQKRIDREELCVDNEVCQVNLKIAIENPLEIHYVGVEVTDINDHAPVFPEKEQILKIAENTLPGADFQLLAARDPDSGGNALRTYKLSHNEHFELEIRDGGEDNKIPILKLQRPLDRERHNSGSPSLSSNVTVNVFILDQNDNVPVILYPVSANGSAEGVEEIPRNVNAGHLVTKVRAYDADIGYNGWLLFSLQEVSDHSPFSLDRYTGQIRTLRSFTETDEAQHKLLILVKDNGNVSLSATATVIVKVVEPKEAFAASDVKHTVKDEEENDVTFYLIITLGSVSVLFVISIIVLIVMQCSKSTDYSSKYLQDTNYDGTLCHSIQYRSGDKRYMLVGPRMSIGSTIAPGSNRNTLVIPDRRRRDSGEVRAL
ncbi:unnamed protein product [Leuciscus chuanchicus]